MVFPLKTHQKSRLLWADGSFLPDFACFVSFPDILIVAPFLIFHIQFCHILSRIAALGRLQRESRGTKYGTEKN